MFYPERFNFVHLGRNRAYSCRNGNQCVVWVISTLAFFLQSHYTEPRIKFNFDGILCGFAQPTLVSVPNKM